MSDNFNFTDSGYTPDSYDFDFNPGYYFYNILAGINDNFTAIWADADASLTSGRMYIASPSALSVINITNKTLVDAYTATRKGAANEYLQQEDIVDINIQ